MNSATSDSNFEFGKTQASVPARMDFAIETTKLDEEERLAYFSVVPDPRRYEQVAKDGETFFLDRFLRLLIPVEVMKRAALKQQQPLPVYSLSPSIKNASSYASDRKSALQLEMQNGLFVAPNEPAVQHEDLEIDRTGKLICFISLDICGSSKVRSQDKNAFEKAYEIFIRELGTVVGQFNGRIHKTTGDGFIAYIDHPAFTRQADNTVDMSLTMVKVLKESINPVLSESELPEFSIRIGAAFGRAEFREIIIPSTNFHTVEIASDALNRAVKIQEDATPNIVTIDRALYEVVHVSWLERATQKSSASNDLHSDKTYEVR
jgi:class 3 adenylate cyclase